MVTVTLAGVTLSRAQQPLPIPVPIGKGPPIEEHITRESATEGPRRVSVPRRYHVSWDDITVQCWVISDADYTTLETAWRNRHSTVAYVYGGYTWTCLFESFEVTRSNVFLAHYQLKIVLRVLEKN